MPPMKQVPQHAYPAIVTPSSSITSGTPLISEPGMHQPLQASYTGDLLMPLTSSNAPLSHSSGRRGDVEMDEEAMMTPSRSGHWYPRELSRSARSSLRSNLDLNVLKSF